MPTTSYDIAHDLAITSQELNVKCDELSWWKYQAAWWRARLKNGKIPDDLELKQAADVLQRLRDAQLAADYCPSLGVEPEPCGKLGSILEDSGQRG